MDITKLSLNELKALAFDEMNRLNMVQSNLKVIYNQISKKMGSSEKPLKKAPKNDDNRKS